MKSIKTIISVLAVGLLTSGAAMAFNDTEQNNTNNLSSSSAAGAAAGVFGSGNSANHNRNSNRNSNSNRAYGGDGGNAYQGQHQGQGQGQGQGQHQGNANEINVDGDDVDQEYYNVNTPSSAGNNVWDCTQSVNVGVSILLGGGSVGIPQDNETCEAGKLLDMARSTGSPHLIDMAERNLRNVLQDKIGYLETKEAIRETEQVGAHIEHNAKPSWCPADAKFGMSESDRKACGL